MPKENGHWWNGGWQRWGKSEWDGVKESNFREGDNGSVTLVCENSGYWVDGEPGSPESDLIASGSDACQALPGFSPTETWMELHKDSGNSTMVVGWSKDDLDALPVNPLELIRVEKHYKNTHIPVYHAHPRYLLAYRMLSEELIKRERGGGSGWEGVTWVRSPYQKPPGDGVIYGNVEEFANRYGLNNEVSLKGDNGMIGSWNLLSCNPSFFQNTNIASEESTADFLFSGMEVSPPDMEKWFDDVSVSIGRNIDSYRLSKEMLSISKKHCSSDILLQILIPNELVNQVCYISKDRGIVDGNNKDAFHTLKMIQNPDTAKSVVNFDSLQVRVYAPLMINPDIGPKIKVIEYGRFSKADLSEDIISIANEIFA